MTPSAQPFEYSHATLKTLHDTVQERTAASLDITLPDRPRTSTTSSLPYLDGAISMISKSTEYLYTRNAPWVLEVLEVKGDVERVHTKIKNFEDDVKGAIKILHGRIDSLDSQVKSLKSQVDEVKSQVDEVKSQVDEVKSQVDEVKSQVDEVKSQVDEVKSWSIQADGRFKGLEGRFTNMGAREPWDDIVPVEYKKQADNRTLGVPSNHPDKVVKLWRLQRPRNRNVLISLLEFYDISGWESWGFEDRLVSDSDSEPDDIGKWNVTLATAVASHPTIALRALTQRLGVNYERIKKRMLECEEDQKRKTKERAIEKRKQEYINKGLGRKTVNESNPPEPSKLRKIDAERASPEELPTRLPRRDLVGYSESNEPKSSPESGSKLLWKISSSSEGAQRRVRDAPYRKTPSEGSTVPFTEEETEKLMRD